MLQVLLFLLLLSLPACYSTPKPRQPALVHEAQRHNLAGVDAEERGDIKSAEAEFAEAYRLFASVENHNGMATVLLNSSRLYRGQGDLEKAALKLNQAQTLLHHVPALEAEICFEAAKLALNKRDIAGAFPLAQRAADLAPDPDRGRMFNLLAGVHLKKGDFKKSRETADTAMHAARSSGSRREEANALRLLGETAFLSRDNSEAIHFYEAALLIDKELAIAPRVFSDLEALSFAAEAAGDAYAAADYLQRAVDAAMAHRKTATSASTIDRLQDLYQRSGRNELAEKVIKLKPSLQPKSAE